MKAVLWTDSLQTIVMSAGILLVFIKCLVETGGIVQIWDIGTRRGRTDMFE